MERPPFFSVLVPSYNRPELIGRAVQSVLANDDAEFELVISDDKSPRQAEIAVVLQPFASDPRVRIHLHPVNRREAANRAFLFGAARGTWQIVLCDDDILRPHALAALRRGIAAHPGSDLYTFGYRQIDEVDRGIVSRRAPRPLRIAADDLRLTRELIVSDSFPFWYFHPASFCSHRRVRERVRPNPDVGIGDDVMFLIDYVNTGGAIQVLPEVLLDYRVATASASRQGNQSADLPNAVSRAKILLHLQQRADLHPTLAAIVRAPECRQRLLFDPVVWSGLDPAQVAQAAALPAALAAELTAYTAAHGRRWHRWRLQWRRVAFFARLFGWRGVRELWHARAERSRYAA